MASFPDVPDALARPFVQAVLRTHPNTHALHPGLALHASAPAILRAYLAPDPPDGLPPPLADCIATVRHHQLPRTPLPLRAPPLPAAHAQGMSPKKAHEVARMAAYAVALVRASSFPEESLHIVDVGAGQGYLTRALKARLPQAHVLALDADEAQTAGAQKWERRMLQGVEPPIAHRTVLIGEGTLLRAVDEWVDEGGAKGRTEENAARAPVPVLFVALHACGSLTPDVLRAFTAARQRTSPASAWYPAAAVVVGCCYNLMHPSGECIQPTQDIGADSYICTLNRQISPFPKRTARTPRHLISLPPPSTSLRRYPAPGSRILPLPLTPLRLAH